MLGDDSFHQSGFGWKVMMDAGLADMHDILEICIAEAAVPLISEESMSGSHYECCCISFHTETAYQLVGWLASAACWLSTAWQRLKLIRSDI